MPYTEKDRERDEATRRSAYASELHMTYIRGMVMDHEKRHRQSEKDITELMTIQKNNTRRNRAESGFISGFISIFTAIITGVIAGLGR